eukprot:CAMPEP_0117449292 /NCGR_PEP_ID=MMETSP0759-20121206/7870_1 /TAXON_ID=63605 /ORGANISM="Percolomonas cosmopolitus, Strain WS" /LENGTH=1115 /DNA_ID=CAMNT_0005241763 /DNA_START=43 /DNA_END=3390 /DNA_ORIENTATION=+
MPSHPPSPQQQTSQDEWLDWDGSASDNTTDDDQDDDHDKNQDVCKSVENVKDELQRHNADLAQAKQSSPIEQQRRHAAQDGSECLSGTTDAGCSNHSIELQTTSALSNDPSASSSSATHQKLTTQIFEMADHTIRTPFEQLCASLLANIRDFLIPHMMHSEAMPRSTQSAHENPHVLFEIMHQSVPLQMVYFHAFGALEEPREGLRCHALASHFPSSGAHHIAYYFSLHSQPYLVMRLKSDALASNTTSGSFTSKLDKSLVRDLVSAWRCCVQAQIMELHQGDATSLNQNLEQWIYLPFFCPSGINYEYHGLRHTSHTNVEHFKCELFDQQSEQWSLRERQVSIGTAGKPRRKHSEKLTQNVKTAADLQDKYRHIAAWLQMFPYLCRQPRTSLREFIDNHPLDYHVQLTYEIENDLLYWGDSLGDEKARLDARLFETDEQASDISTRPHSTSFAPLPFLNFGTLNHPLDIVFCAAQWNNKSLAENKIVHYLDDPQALLENEHELFQLQDVNGWELKIQVRPDSECELSNNLHWFKDMIFAAMSDIAREKETNRFPDKRASSSNVPATSTNTDSPNPEKTIEMVQTAFQSITPYLSTERALNENEMGTIQSILVNKIFGVKLNPQGGKILVKQSSGRKFLPKTFPLNSIFASFSVQAAQLEEYSQIKYLWKMFLMALRECWEKRQLIPNVFDEAPDWDFSILQQKLVLLNCCIRKSVEEVAKQDVTTTETQSNKISEPTEIVPPPSQIPLTPTSDSDDEFVDANSMDSDTASSPSVEEEPHDKETLIRMYEDSRQGALRSLEPPTNLRHIEAPIMVPITQEAPPTTEDKIQEQQTLFAKLGTSKEASQIRQSMQAESLKSDMSAFKAANPDSCFEDFLKWYSPRDIEDGDELSARMNHKNMWQEMWEHAEAKPALEQKSLFNHEREAELVLHYLETFPLDRLMREILIFLVVNGFVALHSAVEDILSHVPFLNAQLQELEKHITQIASNVSVIPERYEALAQHFEKLELLISTVIAVRHQILCPTVQVVPELLRDMFFQLLNDLCEKNVFTFHSADTKIAEEANVFFSERFHLTSGQEATHREYVLRNHEDSSTNQMRITVNQKSLRSSSIFKAEV